MSVPRPTPPPGDPDVQAAFAATLIDEWVRCGVSHAVVCPGSRSTPMAVALAAHPCMEVQVRLDERSAAFTALGIGLSGGRPAVVLTTSGTAAAELHAAVVEADLAGVPLLVCTADRPAELWDVGAPQTIDQTHLYGQAVRWFADPGVPADATRLTWRSLAARAVASAICGPGGPGPVHLNLPFREPLLGDAVAGGVPPGRDDGASWHQVAMAPLAPPDEIVEHIGDSGRRGVRGVIVAGAGCGDPRAVLAMAEALGWPVLADPRSGARRAAPEVVAAADGILRSGAFGARNRPEMVVRLGSPWVSKAVNAMVASAADDGVPVIAVDPWSRWVDPERLVATFVRADPTALCQAVADRLAATPGFTPGASDPSLWLATWQAAEAAAQSAIDAVLAGPEGGMLSEPALARRLVDLLPGDATLMVSSSMPVRDVEAFAAPRSDPPRVVANRGANGIDGVVSTSLGVALAERGHGPVVALVGDLAFLHDVSALVRSAGSEVPCTVVVADNGGGGIFSFLAPAAALEEATFETLFGTPQAPDVAAVAAGFGVMVDDVGMEEGAGRFEELLARHLAEDRLSVIRVRLPGRPDNVQAHAQVNQAVAEAVDAL